MTGNSRAGWPNNGEILNRRPPWDAREATGPVKRQGVSKMNVSIKIKAQKLGKRKQQKLST